MDLHDLTNRPKRRLSPFRKGLWAGTLEGIPAIIIYTILGVPFLTGYLLYLGANSFQVGLVLAVPNLANVMQILTAFSMQKMKSRKWMLLMFGGVHRVFWTLTGVIPFAFPHQWWMPIYLLLYTIAFISNSMGSVIWSSLISDMVPARVRGRYFGIRNTILWAVGSLAMLIGGQILNLYPGGKGFLIIFIWAAVLSMINIALYAGYPNIEMEKSLEINRISLFLKPFRDRGFLQAMLFVSIWLFLQGIAVPFYSYVMLDIMKINYTWVSIATITQNIVMMISYYVWGNLNTRYPTRLLLMWTFPIIALSCLLWPAVYVIPYAAALLIIHAMLGLGLGGYNLLVFNFTIGDTPRADRPMFIAVFSAITGLAGFIGPLVGGALYKWTTHAPLWVQTIGIQTAAGLVLIVIAAFWGPLVFLGLKNRRLLKEEKSATLI